MVSKTNTAALKEDTTLFIHAYLSFAILATNRKNAGKHGPSVLTYFQNFLPLLVLSPDSITFSYYLCHPCAYCILRQC